MPRVLVHDGRFRVECDPWEHDMVRTVPGARFSARGDVEPHWTVPLTWTSAVVLRNVFGRSLVASPEAMDWYKAERSRIDRVLALRDDLSAVSNFSDASEAFPWVAAGTRWALEQGSGLELTPVGGGKTVEFALAMRSRRGPHLVVTTPSMVRTWGRELERWWPGVDVSLVVGNIAARRKALEAGHDVYVIHWHLLPKHSRLAPYGSCRLERCTDCGGSRKPQSCERHPKELNRPWGMVIADEVHNAKRPTGKWTRALWAVGASAQWRWGLTATPIDKRPDEFWSLLRFALPEEWPDHSRYVDRWCDTTWNGYGVQIDGLKDRTRGEFDRVTNHAWRRVPRDVVRQGRPESEVQVRLIDMSPKQRRQYDQMRKGRVTSGLTAGQIVAMNPMSQIGRLYQLASASMDGAGDPRMVAPSNKVDVLQEIMEEAGGEPIVVFAQHRQLLMLAEASLPEGSWASIHGGVTGELRDHALQRFQDGKVPVLLCQYQSGGEGLTLTRSHIMVTLQESWSALTMTQACGRVDRPGQAKPVQVIHLRSEGTLDEAVPRVYEKKAAWLQELVKDDLAVERLMELA